MSDTIADNLQRVQERIAAAAARANRDVSTITLVAVSKTQPPEVILQGVEAGLQHFGENRVEESEVKIPEVNHQISLQLTWHMVGHVQSRKAKSIPPLFHVVHSVDSVKLARKLSAAAVESGKTLEILLEVNVSGEESKSGFAAAGWMDNSVIYEQFCREITEIVPLPGLRLHGLMTMAPIVQDMEKARPVFASLVGLREALSSRLTITLPELSMGMTDDFPVAIEEGATIVRIGRAIFGKRRE